MEWKAGKGKERGRGGGGGGGGGLEFLICTGRLAT